jgi:hypothetical protein
VREHGSNREPVIVGALALHHSEGAMGGFLTVRHVNAPCWVKVRRC